LEQYQPTYVTVVNETYSPTGVHWHGLELDAWADGVPGLSASDGKMSPAIQPDSSFTYKLSLMRPGTFMYHSHLNDIQQLADGLFGPIVVVPPGGAIDPDEDHAYIFGWREAPEPSGLDGIGLNGIPITTPQPDIKTTVGSSHRLRLMNIAAAGNITLNMTIDDEPVPLTIIAKDGADLPLVQQRQVDTLPRLFIGETSDVLFSPSKPGTYTLRIGYNGPAMAMQTWEVTTDGE